MNSFKDRLNQAISNKGISKAELSRITGIGRNSISDYTTGKYEAKQDYVFLLAKALDVNEAWLMGYKVSKERQKFSDRSELIVEINNKYNYFANGTSSERLTLSTVDPFDNISTEKIQISNPILGKYAGEKDIFVTHISTKSVNNTIPNKSLIAVKKAKSIKDLANGDIVLFRENDKISIKRFYNDEKNDVVSFLPDSKEKEFFPSTYRYEDLNDLDIIGKIITYIVEL